MYITDSEGNPLERRYKYLGVTTNNVAEYTGALYGLRRALELGATQVDLYMDSKLVISQLSGDWKVKDADLKNLYLEILKLVGDIDISYNWIPREQNSQADALSNKAMDEKI